KEQPAGAYYYRVRAYNQYGDSAPSNIVRANVAPNPFTDHQDIGDVASPGNASFGDGIYALQASGGDIWNTADGMHFFYRTLTGDGEIVARVLSVGNTDFWAKAGVMIRESLDPGARNAFMLETPHDVSPAHDEPVFQWRSTTGGLTSDSG